MKINNLKDIKNIIDEEIEKSPQLQLSLIKLKRKEIFEDYEKELVIEYVKDKIVFIRVNNSIIRHYIYTNKNKILKKINENISFIIDDINIK